MAASKNMVKQQDNRNESIGLTAIGSAGGWDVAIDETTSGAETWFAQIEGPLVYLCFEVKSPQVVDEMLGFLAGQTTNRGSQGLADGRNGEVVIGRSKKELVTLIRDDEFPDRYFLVAETETKLVVRITIGGTDLKSLVSALRQAKEDLDDDDSE